MPIIRIKSRLNDTNTARGNPGFLYAGELAYNENGLTLTDEQAGGSLVIGNGVRVKVLVSSQRQVEITGSQTILGAKTFRNGVKIGATGNDFDIPPVRGQAGDVLRMNAAGDNTEWGNIGSIAVRYKTLHGRHGSPAANLNDDATGITVTPADLWVIQDTESGEAFLWTGGTGNFGGGPGQTPAPVTGLVSTGSKLKFATSAEVQAETDPQKAIAPDIAGLEFLLKNSSKPQQVKAPLIRFTEKSAGDGFGTVSFESGVHIGKSTKGVTVTAYGGSVLQGSGQNDPLTIKNVIIDAGTF